MSSKNFVAYGDAETIFTGVADAIKERMLVADTMPSSPSDEDVVCYNGETTSSYTKGGIYQYSSGTTYYAWNDGSDNLVFTDSETPSVNDDVYDATGASTGDVITSYDSENDEIEVDSTTYTRDDTEDVIVGDGWNLVNDNVKTLTWAEYQALSVAEQTNGTTYYITDVGSDSSSSAIVQGYYYSGNFYEEASHTTVITPNVDNVYIDITEDVIYRYSSSDGYVSIGSSVAVDSALSSSSENPVQNKVIKAALDDKQDTLTFDSTPTSSSTNPVTSGGVYAALASKQDVLTAGTGISISSNTISNSGVTSFNSRTGAITPAASDYDASDVDYDNTSSGLTATDTQAAIDEVEDRVDDIESAVFASNAGARNCIYRGKYLGTELTSDQSTAIQAGTFDDLMLGDYWTINGVNWRIAGFDYWYNTGDTNCTTHHIVIVPDSILVASQAMNSTADTSTGYLNSDMYTTNIAAAQTIVETAFGSGHILSHREYFSSAASSGIVTAGSWADSSSDLMNELMVYGSHIFAPVSDGSTVPKNHTASKSQLPLFRARPDLIGIRSDWWLRDVVSSSAFAFVSGYGLCASNSATATCGIRPAFAIY